MPSSLTIQPRASTMSSEEMGSASSTNVTIGGRVSASFPSTPMVSLVKGSCGPRGKPPRPIIVKELSSPSGSRRHAWAIASSASTGLSDGSTLPCSASTSGMLNITSPELPKVELTVISLPPVCSSRSAIPKIASAVISILPPSPRFALAVISLFPG